MQVCEQNRGLFLFKATTFWSVFLFQWFFKQPSGSHHIQILTLHVKGDTMQFVEHYVGEYLCNIGGGKDLLSETLIAQIIVEKLVNLIK